MTAPTLPIPQDSNRSSFFICFGAYIAFTLAIAVYAYMSNKAKVAAKGQNEYTTHFVGNKSYSSAMLFLTLFSTIYSGYTVVGVPQEAASLGFYSVRWLSSIAMVWIGLLVFAPRFRRLSVVRNYDSPNDLITDRFDNRILTTLLALLSTVPQIIYILTQFFTMYNLVQVLSLGRMDPSATIVILGVVILACEMLGGFNAVSITDGIQSGIMLVALVLTPIVATFYYGGASGSTQIHCANEVEVSCMGPEFLGTKCAGKNVTNGCLADTKNYLTLYPSVGWSNFTTTNEIGSPDALPHFNFVATNMFSFNLLFFAFALNCHWQQRVMAAKSDEAYRRAMMVMLFAPLVATLPGIFVGIMVAANLELVNQEGSTYGLLLSDFMNRGGFAGVVGVVSACSAIAAIMSTVDSALLGVSNVISKDFLVNWLFKSWPSWNTPNVVTWSSRMISAVIVIVTVVMAVEWEPLHNSRQIYGDLISMQNSILWQGLPAVVHALYFDRVSAWALLAGAFCGIGTGAALQFLRSNCEMFGTDIADCSVKTFYLDGAIWAGVTNFCVSSLLSFVFPTGTPACLRIGTEKFGSNRLTLQTINEAMSTTQEPLRTKTGLVCVVVTVLLTTLSLPWWGTSYNGCNDVTYEAWAATTSTDDPVGKVMDGCGGGTFEGGIPRWALIVIVCSVLSILSLSIAFFRWKTCDCMPSKASVCGTCAPPLDAAKDREMPL